MTRTGQRTNGSTGVGRVVVALLMAMAACVATVSSAAADARPGFSGQAREAGLSGAEARALQAEIDANLAKWGGKQVSANRIKLPGGDLTLALPGEKYARDLGTKGGAQAAGNCPSTYVCAYKGENFTGTQLNFFTCGTLNRITWNTTGSWRNAQKSTLYAKFYSEDKVLRWTSPGGYSEDASADWRWVWYLSPC
ncbi:peptidase inhibitor family I36 protein [Streptomyces sp. cmx-18-6]|uniref:peptidase inhibitor family I36 protein n=1 Tax=Streptomyces sp. cmx-18-6 TaxID=2790930 RepID=UPI003980E4B7